MADDKRDSRIIAKKHLTPASDNTVKQVAVKVCPRDKKRFFEWLAPSIRKMAVRLGTKEEFLYALAAREGGWTESDLDHNQPLNNPFGVNRINGKGQAAGNKKYDSVDAAVDDWISTGQGTKFGDRVRGTQTIDEFIDGLQGKGKDYKPYNSVNPNYESEFKKIYNSAVKYKDNCGY